MSEWIDENPIRSQEEADVIFWMQVQTISRKLNISLKEAEKRFRDLLKSGILDSGNPDDPKKQREIDNFLKQAN